MERELLDKITKETDFQLLINASEFYFQKGQDVLKKWLDMEVSDDLKNKLLELSNDYEKIQNEARRNQEIKQILELLFEIISYCDTNAKDKHIYNKYDDKRCLALAFVRMNNWVEHLILYKLSPDKLRDGSTKNAFKYLLEPENNATILSENHRELISKNLFKNEFNSTEFVRDLISYFEEFNLKTTNPKNYTHLLSNIIYSIQNEWKEEVVALMASDSTGWQDDYINELKNFEACILWNSKRPSGTTESIKFLRGLIDEGKTFNLYYCAGGNVNYMATVIDFVENQEQLDKRAWDKSTKHIMYYQPKFGDYIDSNKKASIVFLAKSLEKINSIPVSAFKFYRGYKVPTQDNLSPIKSEPETISTDSNTGKAPIKMSSEINPLNQILFGPPGTGKTYNTVNKALEIIGENIGGKTRQEIKDLFDAKMKEGQILFTTFHQSMSYEDFIEGIKPVEPEKEGDPVVYRIEPGIFRNLCIEASFAIAQIRESKTTEEVLDFSILYDHFAEGTQEKILNGQKVELETKTGGSVMVESISQQGNFIIKHHDGTRTYTVSKARLTKLQSAINNLDDVSNINDQFRAIIGGSNSSAYWSVLNAIRKEKLTKTITKETRTYTTDDKKEVVLSLTNADFKNTTAKPFVLIIDEINRGNVSQIFGELITLIEEDKRLGKEEALEITLPYSKEKFGVPPNLHIIGTMNTADRSVEALDAALRRRFSFAEMPPIPELIATIGKLKEAKGFLGNLDLPLVLTTINKRIVKLLDKDHQIGHSYLMTVTGIDELKAVFQNKIIPLLQEYFFGDYGKIGLVLGKEFFETVENVEENVFANFNDYDASEFAERTIYKIKDISKMSDGDFNKAINDLLKK